MASIEEAREILKTLGMPPAQHNQMSGLTLIALCGLTPDASWTDAKRGACTVTKGIMDYVKAHYGTEYAPNTRETFRRQVLHQFVQARVADYNPFEPGLSTNSPRAHYAITEAALEAVRHYGTKDWDSAVEKFRHEQGTLVERYERERLHTMIPLKLAAGQELLFSPGKHNEVQKAVVEEFGPRFAPGARLLYVGDTAKKNLYMDTDGLAELSIPITDHSKMPDIVFYDAERNWLFLVEAVTSHGPMSPTRIVDLENMLSECSSGVVYVSAFPDFGEFRRHMKNIAWETEVWLCDTPNHMIHYDGDRFLGPRP